MMEHALPLEIEPSVDALNRPEVYASVMVIGSGPVGVRFVRAYLERQPQARVLLCGNEPFDPYNRVQLSAFLAGGMSRTDLNLALPSPRINPNFEYRVASIASIAPDRKQAVDQLGRIYRYDTLVLATGARAHRPNIPGIDQVGVYTFRNLKDADHLYARTARARHLVVLGGGLLGLEAAVALSRSRTEVTVIQQGAWLMNRQLDDRAADLLRRKVEGKGIRVIVRSGVREIYGDGRVTAVRTYDDRILECDTVLVCAGIQPNTALALNAGLSVGQGIRVNDRLQTSDPSIYAIGECCEHRGRTYGLVAPGFEQAAVAAKVLVGEQADYEGSQISARLKVVGEPVCSLGEVNDLPRRPYLKEWVYQQSDGSTYRKIVAEKGRVTGVVGYGDWAEFSRVQSLYQQQKPLAWWRLWWFQKSGHLGFGRDGSNDPSQWPLDAVVCQCNQVTRGQLSNALPECRGLLELKTATGAGTVCGSCQPYLEQLLGGSGPRSREAGWRVAAISSLLAFVLATVLLAWPAASVSDSVQQVTLFEQFWNDKFWKQVTGFSLLGLSAVALLMSLRKRLNWQWMGAFVAWRGVHTGLGVMCLLVLMVHTGFHLGSQLNAWLIANFVSVIALGAGAGAAIAVSHRLPPAWSVRMRRSWRWLHLLVSWPLPVLLAAHIVSVYYF